MALTMTRTPRHATSEDPADRALMSAGVLYAFGTLVHTIDHFRRGAGSVSWELVEVGTIGTVLAAVAVTLIFTRHRLAPFAALAVGLPHGLGIAAVHFLPHWSVLSDQIASTNPQLLSFVAVILEVVGALATAAAGAYVLGRRSSFATA